MYVSWHGDLLLYLFQTVGYKQATCDILRVTKNTAVWFSRKDAFINPMLFMVCGIQVRCTFSLSLCVVEIVDSAAGSNGKAYDVNARWTSRSRDLASVASDRWTADMKNFDISYFVSKSAF